MSRKLGNMTVKATRPGAGSRSNAPDFVPLKYKGENIGGDSKAGACKDTGCYGKFFFKDGLPRVQVCSAGKAGAVFPVASVADAKAQLAKKCVSPGAMQYGRFASRGRRANKGKRAGFKGLDELMCLAPIGHKGALPVDVGVETPAYWQGKAKRGSQSKRGTLLFDRRRWRKVACPKGRS